MSWADVANETNRRSSGDIVNLKFVSGNNYNVRFVGDPHPFYKYFINNKSAITDAGEDCIIRRKYNIEANVRYAVNLIDRADGKLKIAEVPPSVLKPVVAWWKARKNDPGGDNGCDFNVDVTGQKKMTRYTVTPLDITPFTEQEKQMIEREYKDLKKLYKATSQEEIEARLGFTQSAPPQAPQQAVPAGGPPQPAATSGQPGWSDPPF